MAIDFDAIKRKLDRLSGNSSSRNTMWKPVEGEKHTVRLLSFPDNDGQPFKEMMFYYNIPGQRGLLAPSQFGKKDPIQELINKLRDEGTKESYEMAKKLYPKMRVYAACIVRGEESEGVKLWGFGKTVYQKLLSLMCDEDYLDITDPITGRDVNVVCSKNPGQQWAMTEVTPRGRESKLSKEASQATEWMKNLPDVENIFQLKSYDELSKIVNDWLAVDEDGETSAGTEHNSSVTSSEEKTKGTYSSLDDAFADLME